jgi:hypothetical protein
MELTNEIPSLVNTFGLPTALLLGQMVVLWRVLRWSAPKVEKLISSAALLIEDMRTSNAEVNNEILQVSREILTILKTNHDIR